MTLLILAWYTLVFMTLSCVFTISNDKNSGRLRVTSVLFTLPILLFALLYVL